MSPSVIQSQQANAPNNRIGKAPAIIKRWLTVSARNHDANVVRSFGAGGDVVIVFVSLLSMRDASWPSAPVDQNLGRKPAPV
jgi:hypothetical protein